MTAAIQLARDLADKLHAIALHENAGQCFTDIQNIVDTIERSINRPIPPRYCGPCPTLVDGEHCSFEDNRGKKQRTALTAPREATEITCHNCQTIHNIAEIEKQLWSEVGQWLLSPYEIRLVMDHFGEPVAESTLRRWRATGKLQPRGQRNGKPHYWADDVRTLRNRKAK